MFAQALETSAKQFVPNVDTEWKHWRGILMGPTGDDDPATNFHYKEAAMDKLREDLTRVSARLEELENSHKVSLQEIGGLKQGVGGLTHSVDELKRGLNELKRGVKGLDRSVDGLRNSTSQALQATTDLRGIFSSIDTHMVNLFEADGDLKAQVADLTLRVETLEKKAS